MGTTDSILDECELTLRKAAHQSTRRSDVFRHYRVGGLSQRIPLEVEHMSICHLKQITPLCGATAPLGSVIVTGPVEARGTMNVVFFIGPENQASACAKAGV